MNYCEKNIEKLTTIIANIIVIIGAIMSVWSIIKSNMYYKTDIDVTFSSSRCAQGFGNDFIIRNNTSDVIFNNLVFKLDDGIFILDDLVGDARVSDNNNIIWGDNTFVINRLLPGDSVIFSFATNDKVYESQFNIFSVEFSNKYNIDINNKNKNKVLSSLIKYIVIFIIGVILFDVGIIYILVNHFANNKVKKKTKHNKNSKSIKKKN